MLLRSLIFFLMSIFIFSCASKKDILYFQDIKNSNITTDISFLTIQPGDILDIQIKGLNPESTMFFQPSALNQANLNLENRLIDGYLVGEKGQILLPILGSVSTEDETTFSLASKIIKKLEPYVKNPSVNIRVINFRVSVLGEVVSPGTFTVLQERLSIMQALGLAGDLTINGDRSNVILIRNENGIKKNYNINLTSSSFMNSPYYFLKQNDIIYVQQNTARVKSSGIIGNVGNFSSVVSLLVSLFLIFSR